jgi:SET domain-containing protein
MTLNARPHWMPARAWNHFKHRDGHHVVVVIDALKHGNYTRFINHGRRGNVGKPSQTGIFTARVLIRAGDELVYDYGFDPSLGP